MTEDPERDEPADEEPSELEPPEEPASLADSEAELETFFGSDDSRGESLPTDDEW